MALTKIHRLYAVKCGSTVFSQLNDAVLSANVRGMTHTPPGGSLALFTANMQERPSVSMTTTAIEQALTLFGVAGGSAGATTLFGQQMTSLSGPTAIGSSAHATWAAPAALGYINQISAGNRTPATAQCMLRLLRSGATAAITYAGTAAISDTLTGAEHFVMGPLVVGGSVIEGTNGLTIAFNPVVVDPDADYQVEPIFACINSAPPVFTFTSTDPDVWDLHNTEFDSGGSGAFKANLIKIEANQQQYAAASTEHILFTSNLGRITCESVGGARQLTRVRIDPVSSDGSTAEAVATLNSAVATS